MPLYRAYLLDDDGHVVGAIDLECADDEEAREMAKQLGNHDVKLWRQVEVFEPESPSREQGQ